MWGQGQPLRDTWWTSGGSWLSDWQQWATDQVKMYLRVDLMPQYCSRVHRESRQDCPRLSLTTCCILTYPSQKLEVTLNPLYCIVFRCFNSKTKLKVMWVATVCPITLTWLHICPFILMKVLNHAVQFSLQFNIIQGEEMNFTCFIANQTRIMWDMLNSILYCHF